MAGAWAQMWRMGKTSATLPGFPVMSFKSPVERLVEYYGGAGYEGASPFVEQAVVSPEEAPTLARAVVSSGVGRTGKSNLGEDIFAGAFDKDLSQADEEMKIMETPEGPAFWMGTPEQEIRYNFLGAGHPTYVMGESGPEEAMTDTEVEQAYGVFLEEVAVGDRAILVQAGARGLEEIYNPEQDESFEEPEGVLTREGPDGIAYEQEANW